MYCQFNFPPLYASLFSYNLSSFIFQFSFAPFLSNCHSKFFVCFLFHFISSLSLSLSLIFSFFIITSSLLLLIFPLINCAPSQSLILPFFVSLFCLYNLFLSLLFSYLPFLFHFVFSLTLSSLNLSLSLFCIPFLATLNFDQFSLISFTHRFHSSHHFLQFFSSLLICIKLKSATLPTDLSIFSDFLKIFGFFSFSF